MGQTFNILSRLAGGYAAAADEQREAEHKADREQRRGLANIMARMLEDPKITDETRELLGRKSIELWDPKNKKFSLNLADLSIQGEPEQAEAASPRAVPFPGAASPPPAPEGVAPAPQVPSQEAVTNLYLTKEQQDAKAKQEFDRKVALEESLAESRARGTAAGTPVASVKLQRVQIADPNNPEQTIFASYNPETGRFQDTKGVNIESPLTPKEEPIHTPYRDFRVSQIAAGVSPLDIPKLWNQQQVALQQRFGMGLLVIGRDPNTGEDIYVWLSEEERKGKGMPSVLAGVTPRQGVSEEAKRLNAIVQSLLRSLESGTRLYKLLGIALNPDLEGNDEEAVKAGRAAYKRWLKGAKGGVPPPPDERGEADTHPEGTRAELKDGTIVVKRGGKWVPVR